MWKLENSKVTIAAATLGGAIPGGSCRLPAYVESAGLEVRRNNQTLEQQNAKT